MKISNWILASTLCGFISAGGSAVFAQTISHFNVTGIPQTIQPGGDSIDLTIEAIGGDGQIVDDWNGEVSLSFLIPQETPVFSELKNTLQQPPKPPQPPKLEITNPGRGSMDLSGWKIRFTKSLIRHTNPFFEFELPENTILPPQSVMTLVDDQTPDTFGEGLHFKYPDLFQEPIFFYYTQLVNTKGDVIDEFYENSVPGKSFHGQVWTDNYEVNISTNRKTLIRHGKDNHFTPGDWILASSIESSFGEINPELKLPWDHESLRIPLETAPIQLVNGKWSGSISMPADLPSGSVLIRAYTARGAIGTSTLAEVLAFPKLDWSLPEGFEAASENDAGQIVEAELSIPSSQDTDVTITITSLGVGEFEFPESVTIPAGTTFVKVPFTILDDELVDGLTRLRIMAEAENFQAGELELLSEDNESGELVLFHRGYYPTCSLCAYYEEGRGLYRDFGIVGITNPLVNDLVVHFEWDGILESPEKVIIPAGNVIQFVDLYVGDDSKPNEFPFYNTITAKVSGWPEVSIEALVENNDSYPRTIVEVDNFREGFPNTVTFGLQYWPIDHDLVYTVTITLPNEHAGRAIVFPETVTLPAGEQRTSFEIFFPDNGILDENYNFYLDISNPVTWGGNSRGYA